MSLFQRLKTFFLALRVPHYRWPALDVDLPGGQHLHLVGSIHMGTYGMSPLPAQLLQKLRDADALIVEADIAGSDSPFDNLPPAEPLEQRLPPELLAQLDNTLQTLSLHRDEFDQRPAWHIALVLQATQAQRLGLRPEYGIDYQLLQAAQQYQVKVMELEGTSSQLDILRRLPDEGNELLQDTLTHWHENARLLQVMMSWWLENPPTEDELMLPSTFSQPLHDVLMHQRNQAWCERLFALPPGRYVVAAGALHLYGEGNLPALLRERAAQ
ncbi:TraB/GumN family protein [Kosakonia pseudosacchari]|uniref:Conjugal transfer protein TraB n=1 Tax=Kosakonia pseudosacchari TaxID=1646340 RepID=A0ABX4IPK7_9ENTR|nr:TraB/GumN family protein [Kosakonia pseudosacchari]PDO84698.1 conjugal transfer protein TraB [Kosakonia pseudosacchari]WBU48322.1 TraB/GumN family protein [Kosakonia pseudosacchari]